MNWMKFNLNDIASVKLTEYGAEVLNKYYDHLAPKGFGKFKVVEGEERDFTIWNLMAIFGNEQYNGNPKICFENNNIVFKRRGGLK